MRRLVRVAEEEIVLVILLAAFAVVFLSVFPPHLLVNDSFLTLTAGREVAGHGLPSQDELTVIGAGRTWTDQQWGAQLLAYGVYELGGHALLAVASSLFPLTAFVVSALASRSLGAGPRAFVLVFFPVIIAASWAWTIRAQVFVLPLYAGLVWLLLSETRRPSRRIYLALPLLVVWANLHGSVALGALLVMLFAVVELVSTRGRSLARAVLLFVLAPLMVLATPYGPVETARYYRLMLLDPPFANRVTEWQWSDPDWNTLAFYALAALALTVAVRGRRRLRPFDAVLLLVTFVGGVQALRGIQWFAFACLIVLPIAIGTSLEGATAPVRRRLNRTLVVGVSAVLVALVAFSFVRDASWYERNWPNEALASVREASSNPARRVFATDRHSDWLLWKLPELRGRVAYDVRFEIYEASFFDRLAAYYGQIGNWKELAADYDVVVVDEKASSTHTDAFLAEPGSRILYRDEVISVVLRRARS